MIGAPHLSSKVYGVALHLYPPAFRREFGAEMSLDFGEASRDTWDKDGWRGLAPFWLSIAVDLLITVAREWCRTKLPLVAMLSFVPVAAFLGLLSRLGPATPVALPDASLDRDILALLLIVSVVLLLIFATIVFTLWFARPLLVRRR